MSDQKQPGFAPYRPPHPDPASLIARAEAPYAEADTRRRVRHFSSERVPRVELWGDP